MGALSQALETIFGVQRKRRNEKITRKISIPTYKTLFSSFFLLFGPLLLSNLVTFLSLIPLK